MTTYLNPSTRVGGVQQVVVAERAPSSQVDDAPYDDEQYVRVNGEWVPYDAPPIIPDTLEPKPPTALNATGTMAANGSRVDYTLSWAAPTQNVDDSPLDDFAYYVLRWRYGTGGVYQSFTTTDTSFLLPGLVPGASFEWSVLARDYSGNDSAWADKSTAGLADTTGPNQPSTPILNSRLGAVVITWDGRDAGSAPMPADFAYLEVYVASITGGPWTTVGRLTGAGALVHGGATIGENRFVTFIAYDRAGNPSTRSGESAILVTGVTGPDLEANSVTANAIDAGAVGAQQLSSIIAVISKLCSSESGRRWEADVDGIRLYDVDGTLLVNFSTDPATPASIAGDLVASSLTVKDQLAIRGLVNEISKGAQLILAAGTTAPSSPPVVSVGWDSVDTATDGSDHATSDPQRVGLAAYGAMWAHATNTGTGGASGTASFYDENGDTNIFGIGWFWPETVRSVTSVTILGGVLYYLGIDSPASFFDTSDGFYYVEGHNLADGALTSRWKYPHVFPSGTTGHRKPQLSNDGTNLLIAYTDRTTNLLYWRKFAPTTGAQVGGTITSNLSLAKEMSALTCTQADFGGWRVVVVPAGEATARVLNASGVVQPNEDFPLPSTNITGIAWDPNNSRFASHDPAAARLYRHTPITWATESSTWYSSVTWYDPDATGGTHETAQGPRKAFTMKKRAKLTVQAPPLPLRPVPNTTDDASSARVYLGRGAVDPTRTGMNLASTLPVGQVVAGFSAYTHPGAGLNTPPPSSSNFPVTSPGQILSADRTTFGVTGEGYGFWGGFTHDSTGTQLNATKDLQAAGASVGRGQVPGGYSYLSTDSATSNSTTIVNTALSVTVSLKSTRRYRLLMTGSMKSTAAGDRGSAVLREGATNLQVGQTPAFDAANSSTNVAVMKVIDAPSTGTHTYTVGVQRVSGTGAVSLVGGSFPSELIIEDIGAAGV